MHCGDLLMTCLLARSMRITSTMPPVRLNWQEATVPNQMSFTFLSFLSGWACRNSECWINLVLLWIWWTLSSSGSLRLHSDSPGELHSTTFSHTVSVMIIYSVKTEGPPRSTKQLAPLCFSPLFYLIERHSALSSATRNENRSASVQTSRIDISSAKVRVCRAWHQVHPAHDGRTHPRHPHSTTCKVSQRPGDVRFSMICPSPFPTFSL